MSVSSLQAFPAKPNKHSSLVQKLINSGQKSFITLAPGPRELKRWRHDTQNDDALLNDTLPKHSTVALGIMKLNIIAFCTMRQQTGTHYNG